MRGISVHVHEINSYLDSNINVYVLHAVVLLPRMMALGILKMCACLSPNATFRLRPRWVLWVWLNVITSIVC